VDDLRCLNLLQRVDVSELTVRVVRTVTVVLLSYFRKVLRLTSVLFHVFASCVTKDLGCPRTFRSSSYFKVFYHELFKRVSSVVEHALQRSCEHFLESEGHDTLRLTP
jgi:hypothetical protein